MHRAADFPHYPNSFPLSSQLSFTTTALLLASDKHGREGSVFFMAEDKFVDRSATTSLLCINDSPLSFVDFKTGTLKGKMVTAATLVTTTSITDNDFSSSILWTVL